MLPTIDQRDKRDKPPPPGQMDLPTNVVSDALEPPPASCDSLPTTGPTPSHTPTRPRKKATISELRTELMALGLDATGKKDTLYKRLLAAFMRAQEAEAAAAEASEPSNPRPPRQPYLSYLCFDVEGTCEAGTNFDYPNEIIEFPVVLLQWAEDDADEESTSVLSQSSSKASNSSSRLGGRTRRLHIIDTFHSYVRPTWRPKLSEFCTHLTGIQQSTVDAAPTFPEVLLKFEDWLDSWGLREDDRLKNALWITDGPWDLRDFIPKQLHITPPSPRRYPQYLLGPYLNLKRAVATVLSADAETAELTARGFKGTTSDRKRRDFRDATGANRYLNIPGQLEALGLGTFEGRQHSGIDDATNIARILIALTERDILIEANAFLPPARNVKRWPWMGKPGEVIYNEPMLQGMVPRAVNPIPPNPETEKSSSDEDPLIPGTPAEDVTVSSSPTPTEKNPSTPEPMLSHQTKKKTKTKRKSNLSADDIVENVEGLSLSHSGAIGA